jgi:hypothetical protein
VRSVYSIRLRVTDSGGLWHEQTFTVTIIDLIEHFIPFLP